MSLTEIKPGIRYVGVNDRKTTLFEGLWSLGRGVSYNAYLVIGEKIALIDTVEEGFGSELFDNIRREIGSRPIDYLIVNHMEPDHSSSMASLRQIYPNIEIVGNAKTIQMIRGYYSIEEGLKEIKEGETLDLGLGKVLSFHLIPMVHWPETMVTWCESEKTVFSGDAFGTFGALDGGITDEAHSFEDFREEMRRYYACIVGKYGAPVQKALAKLSKLDLGMICPTHGPVWQREIRQVIDLYDRMSRYEGEEGVVIAYGSMYGNTERMAEQIARELSANGIRNITVHNLSVADPSFVLRDIFRYNSLILGSPTYNGVLFPPVAALIEALVLRGIPQRHFAAFGSYTWANTATRCLNDFAARMKWNPVIPIGEMKQGFSETANGTAAREIAEAIAACLKH